MGLIIRTAGANKTKNEINYDLENLIKIWEEVKKKGNEFFSSSFSAGRGRYY